MNIKALGIDIAKNVFELHGVDATGKTVLKKRLTRDKLPEVIAQLPACLIGIEACGGSHYWGRKFKAMGHNEICWYKECNSTRYFSNPPRAREISERAHCNC